MKIIRKRKKKGFTLIELIAVVAILLILAVILVPNIVGYVNKSKIATVKSDAKTVLNVIRTAKADSDTPDSITTYAQAIAANNDLAPSTAVPTPLTTMTENELQKDIIDNSSTSWGNYSAYNTTSSN
ncbi:type II secretion system protein [Clostridium guangxiense]|uniref:type II secretion system protein n=1 Tax=Clostridium guangxiense TaxID=1662055 RepID=UPI001E448218|nr:type II secretion system protein [Clostridium guangxiense]MCD2346463.1 type II secretion system GspH family protein [Clostridium guangxiense]